MANNNIGKRLLPVVIDETAARDPDRAWVSLPIDDYDLERGFEDVSYAAFANGINKLAHCIVAAFGPSDTFETVMYLGVPDLRYYMLLYAVCKTGHKVLFSSHHNTLETHLSLMKQTTCRYMLLSRGVYAGDILEQRPMPSAELPELDDLLDMGDMATPFPYTKTYEEAKHDPFVICHTSGTTGPPKPITYTHASMATMDRHTELPACEGREHFTWQCPRGTRYLMIASPFHAISVVVSMTISAFGGATLLPGFRDRPVEDINDLCEIIKHSRAHTGFIPSFLMEIIARRDDAEDYIKQFQSLTYANGILSEYAGRIWSKHVPLNVVWGATEVLTPPLLEADPEDYDYVHFDLDAAGMEFRPRDDLEYFGDDGSRLPLYEMVLTLTPQSLAFASYWAGLGITTAPTSPPYPEYCLGEVWTPHPDPQKQRYAWRFVRRICDLVTNGGDFAIAMEKAICNNKKVQNCATFEKHGKQPVVLIELAEDVSTESALDIWNESINPENEDMPEHAKIPASHVVLVENGGFVRGSEGHLSRSQTQQKYLSEINAVYGIDSGPRKAASKPRYESIIQTVETLEIVE